MPSEAGDVVAPSILPRYVVLEFTGDHDQKRPSPHHWYVKSAGCVLLIGLHIVQWIHQGWVNVSYKRHSREQRANTVGPLSKRKKKANRFQLKQKQCTWDILGSKQSSQGVLHTEKHRNR